MQKTHLLVVEIEDADDLTELLNVYDAYAVTELFQQPRVILGIDAESTKNFTRDLRKLGCTVVEVLTMNQTLKITNRR